MKSIPSQQAPKKGTFSKAQAHHKWLFTPIACTKLSYVDLEWEDFSSFWDFMWNDWKLEEYVYDHYLDLGDFLHSLWEHRKNNNILWWGEECTPPMCWKLRLGGGATSDNEHQCPSKATVMLFGSANIGQRKCGSSTCTSNKALATSERGKWIDQAWRMPWRL
jgi:hypothetical protein